ncbi:hypothetical protein FC99_GL001597 [Levilactobacillus koreensis JCM 16448]|uniref:hypothetical protein n=1 Tax=Levilactobacillus koreensis TaxID=637971 RepID=UPI0006F0AEE0|nr:hypothetical protein [Levilactobacillus koreensis]KRK86433.1 hypothetical protein FC99_GL001597 [Levilactobacillus koreensis JCM 16448]
MEREQQRLDTGLAAELNAALKTKRTQLELLQLLYGQTEKAHRQCSSASTEQVARTDAE